MKHLTLAAVVGLLYWLFGNLYEAVVFSPNWIHDSPAQMARLNEFFTTTGPTLYFVPVTQIALVVVWLLWWRNHDVDLARDYRRAGLTAIALAVVTAVIVALVIPKLFGSDHLEHPERLRAAAWQWNVLNVVRMVLTAMTAAFLFSAYRTLDRRTGRG